MNKSRFLVIFIFVCIFLPKGTSADYLETTLKETKKFIESFEWTIVIKENLDRFKDNKELYMVYLDSEDNKQVYISTVMLGLLKSKEAGKTILNLQPKHRNEIISRAFALCRMNIAYEKNYKYLESVGTETQDAGGARSLLNLDAVILLSFLKDKRFPKYAEKVKQLTQEAYQREAVMVALKRYEILYNEDL